ncbi:hypothetical protein Nepgr_029302 [Nepenthes gracilis]|uniref:Eukaryotic translation initiation factor 3 subunit M n=1 Tax=Nepenthes gracilis TaxID=150966 RepID=A0AAD3TDT5_NEPGR|nr:hypothetical protein Nepgr_029302 [Nepenthes gracilis]
MTTIVPTTEEDPALAVVRFVSELAWADAGAEVAEPQVARLCREAQECMVVGRWLDLASLMLTSADLIFSKVAEKDLECIYTVICNLVSISESPDLVLEMVKLITAKITQQPTEKPALRLKILFNLYNLLENAYCRFYVYMKALNLAVSGNVTEYVIPSFKKIDNFLKEWNIGVQDQRELFLTISKILKESKSSGKDSFHFLTKYLATFSGNNAYDDMTEAKEDAVHAVIEFVKAPDIFQCDLLDLPAVTQLENDGKYSMVFQLLWIFLFERLDSYLNFQATNSTSLKSYGLVHEDCIAKMRLISLLDLASNESGQIPYALIKETLRINDDEVEYWVIKAISAKLLECKMDQMNQVVVVRRNTERIFGQQQWESMRAKLATWRGNITNVISTIQANKVVEDGMQAAQSTMIR